MADKDSKKEPKTPLLVKKEGESATVGEEDKTVKIPKPLKKDSSDKKVVLNSATDSTIRPSDATTMAPAVEMRKTETGNVEIVDNAPPPLVAKSNNDTGGASKTPAPIATEATANKGRKTIKLKPLKKNTPEDESAEETMSMDRSDLMNDMTGLGGDSPENLEDESTVKIQKPQATKTAHPTPNIPGSKDTIKLRPSTATGLEAAIGEEDNENEETVSVSKKTIRLVPKKPGDDDATQKTPKLKANAAKPSAPTVKLQEPVNDATQKTPKLKANVAKPSAPTIKLQEPVNDVTQKTPRPSAPTIKLPDTPAPEAEKTAAPASSKKTLKLKASTPPPAAAPQSLVNGDEPSMAAPASKKMASTSEKGSDPGIIMTLVAVFAVIAVSYYVWMVAGQWAELHQDVRSANVPALSGTVK